MTRKALLLSIALIAAVTIPAQNNVPLSERLSKSNVSLCTYTYDSNNNILTELPQNWQNDSWVNVFS